MKSRFVATRFIREWIFYNERELRRNSHRRMEFEHRERVFQLHRHPKSSASGERNRDSLLDSIRSSRFIVFIPDSSSIERFWQFMLRETRSGTYCVSIICLPNIRSVNREGWSYQEEDFPFFFGIFTNPIRGLKIYFDKVLNISSFNRRKFWTGRFIKLKNIWIL